MKNDSLVIMAGGASSRMKKSLMTADLNDKTLTAAKSNHKSLIPLGESGRPLLYHLLKNAMAVAVNNVYIITSPENRSFKEFTTDFISEKDHKAINIHLAVQHLSPGSEKPLGTADALQQCLDQFPQLLEERFTVCNGDNLYSKGAIDDLRQKRDAPNALISYSSDGLQFSDERIAKFAVMDIDVEGYLQNIVEKPNTDELYHYRDEEGILRVSMNIFNFSGEMIYPYLKNCKIHPVRGEKELPQAVRALVGEIPKSMLCLPRSEDIPDLTTAHDIKNFNLYL